MCSDTKELKMKKTLSLPLESLRTTVFSYILGFHLRCTFKVDTEADPDQVTICLPNLLFQ
jgi:hypothetical protein